MVPRKVRFYQMDAGERNGQPVPFPIGDLLGHISQLTEEQRLRRYAVAGQATDTFCWVDRAQTEPPYRARFAVIRMAGLPAKFQLGNLEDLDMAAGEGLAEICHVLFFQDAGNTVAKLYNHHGPRIGRILTYLQDLAPDSFRANHPLLDFDRLVRRDAWERCQRVAAIKLLSLRVRPSTGARREDANNKFARALRVLFEGTGARDIEITLNTGSRSRTEPDSLSTELVEEIREVILGDEFATESAELSGFVTNLQLPNRANGRPHLDSFGVDLVDDSMLDGVEVRKRADATNLIEDSSAYAALLRSYHDNYETIQQCVRISRHPRRA